MRIKENDCVDCGLPCIGRACPYREVEHIYCDDCGCEIWIEEMHTECNGEEVCDICHNKRREDDDDESVF